MTIVQYELVKLKQQEIEVRALVALMQLGRNSARRLAAESKLCKIAFPEDLAENINQEMRQHAKNIEEIYQEKLI